MAAPKHSPWSKRLGYGLESTFLSNEPMEFEQKQASKKIDLLLATGAPVKMPVGEAVGTSEAKNGKQFWLPGNTAALVKVHPG